MQARRAGMQRGATPSAAGRMPRQASLTPKMRRIRRLLAARASTQTATTTPTSQVVTSSSAQAFAGVKTVKQLKMRSAACYLPHPDKEHYGGEDAHFISAAGGGAIGVADGVGGWAESGINPAEYSRTFMRVACAVLEGADPVASMDDAPGPDASISPAASTTGSYASMGSMDGDALAPACPRAAMDTAHKLTRVPGSATACVMALDQERRALRAANLGDSGFLVVRKGQVALRSSPLQHFFDCPLQFGAFPEHVEATDTADEAEMYHVQVEDGDVIIAGSDGLWDNMYESEIVGLAPKSQDDVRKAARAIALLAREHASDPAFASPYTREALKQGYDLPLLDKLRTASFKDGKLQLGELTGGKQDDITVLVAMVVEEEVPVAAPDVPEGPMDSVQAAAPAAPVPVLVQDEF